MAIITLRQLLHRPAPGGPISANDPLPVRLYGPNGQPISQQTPLDVRDQQLRDFLGSVHDEESDALKVALSGSSVPYTAPLYVNRPVRSQVQTLLNAVSVPAGGNTGWVDVSPGGERYIILLFNCDQPWRAWTNAPWASVEYGFLYPRRDDADQTPATLVNYPTRSVVVAPLLEGGVASMAEAFAAALPWSGLRVRIDNKGAATATITLRVLRLFV